jgi:hypothetical protein
MLFNSSEKRLVRTLLLALWTGRQARADFAWETELDREFART